MQHELYIKNEKILWDHKIDHNVFENREKIIWEHWLENFS